MKLNLEMVKIDIFDRSIRSTLVHIEKFTLSVILLYRIYYFNVFTI